MRHLRRGLTVVTATALSMVVSAVAWAQTPDPETVVTDAASSLSDTLLAIVAAVLPFAIGIVAVILGWKLALRFFKRA